MNKVLSILLGISILMAIFFSCKHPLNNILDPASGEYIGIISADADGDGIGQWEDVDEISLGTNICVSHAAATPPGMQVDVEVKLLEVSGPKTKWSIVARDELDVIGEGTHERFTIERNKFSGIVAKKAANVPE